METEQKTLDERVSTLEDAVLGYRYRQDSLYLERELKVMNIAVNDWLTNYAAKKAKSTPLLQAIAQGRMFVPDKEIADCKGNLDYVDPSGQTPLTLAVNLGRKKVVDALLDAGASVDFPNEYGETPLYCAATCNDRWQFKNLVYRGANINAPRRDGFTPVFCLVHNNNKDLLLWAIAHGANIFQVGKEGRSAFRYALEQEKFDMAADLLRMGADINERGYDGDTPLVYAVKSGSQESYAICEFLIKNGADVNRPSNGFAYTALHASCIMDEMTITGLLLKNGADASLKDPHGHKAVWYLQSERSRAEFALLASTAAKKREEAAEKTKKEDKPLLIEDHGQMTRFSD